MSDAPLVSVLIPTYNREDYLPDCLGTALAQTCGDLEIVVCDNASTDATVAVARAFAAQDRRVRVEVNDTNIGPVGNFRRCLELARGRYIKFLMSDDRLRPEAVARLVAAIESDPSVVLATSSRGLFDAAGAPLPGLVTAMPVNTDAIVEGWALGDLVLSNNVNMIGEPTTVLFRRASVRPEEAFTFAGRPYRVAADVALWLTLLAGGRAAYLTEPLSDMRIHPGQDQRNPEIWAEGVIEWWTFARDAHLLGFLRDDNHRAMAVASFLRNAMAILEQLGPEIGAGIITAISEATVFLQDLQPRLGGV